MLRSSQILNGECREVLATLPERSVQCVVTSPPYWGLRDYGVDGQLGSEPTLDEYIAGQVEVFGAVRRVLRDDGTLWLNMGDAYASKGICGGESPVGATSTRAALREGRERTARTLEVPEKNLIGQPWRLAFALQADGWYLRSDIIWAKPNPMPESVTDRPTKSHEYVFLLTKRPTYFYDADAVRERDKGTDHVRNVLDKPEPSGGVMSPHMGIRTAEGRNGSGRNLRTVWQIATQPYAKAHFATFPEKLVVPCIKAGTSEKGCCPACLAPWRRVVEKDESLALSRHGTAGYESGGLSRGCTFASKTPRVSTSAHTIGWQPGCECGPSTGLGERYDHAVPCTVLDPYCGSGTTGVVAKQLGRSFIGIELNPEYCEMARKRIENPYPKPEVEDVSGQEMLFGLAPAPAELGE